MAEHTAQTVAQNRQTTASVSRSPEFAKRQTMREQSEVNKWQTAFGNQAIQRSLAAGGTGVPFLQRKCAACTKQEDQLGRGVVQTKLAINKPGDVFEQEADRIAVAVMDATSMYSSTPIGGTATAMQRSCECGGTCADCKRDQEVMQRSMAHPASQTGTAPAIVHEVLSTPGHSLDGATRDFMESRFGTTFESVRVHTDSRAAESASTVNALAYTVGKDVVFARNQYAPTTQHGQRLLAHELTHVLQQDHARFSRHNAQEPRSNQNSLLSRTEKVLQRACGKKGIGTPGDCVPSKQEPVGDLVLFKVNCDDFATARDKQTVVDFADSMDANDSVVVHGLASTDGDATFNDNLSCARAVKAKNVLKENKIDEPKISLIKHGATPGPAAQRRSVVLERTPGASRPSIPQLRAEIETAPTGGICGGDTFRIRWSLSRNSDALGGFVIQDVLFNWNVRDCKGATVPTPPFTSPLRYFETWRVPPTSTQPNATAFTKDTDRFFWPDTPPWGGGCSDGKVTITATARYFDKQAAAALPPSMVQFNPKTFAQDLFSGLSDPKLGGTVSRPLAHSISFHWKCCPCSSSPTVVDSHTP